MYRPFTITWVYRHKVLNPTNNDTICNTAIHHYASFEIINKLIDLIDRATISRPRILIYEVSINTIDILTDKNCQIKCIQFAQKYWNTGGNWDILQSSFSIHSRRYKVSHNPTLDYYPITMYQICHPLVNAKRRRSYWQQHISNDIHWPRSPFSTMKCADLKITFLNNQVGFFSPLISK